MSRKSAKQARRQAAQPRREAVVSAPAPGRAAPACSSLPGFWSASDTAADAIMAYIEALGLKATGLIFEANKPVLKNPDLIYPGQVLRIPPA